MGSKKLAVENQPLVEGVAYQIARFERYRCEVRRQAHGGRLLVDKIVRFGITPAGENSRKIIIPGNQPPGPTIAQAIKRDVAKWRTVEIFATPARWMLIAPLARFCEPC